MRRIMLLGALSVAAATSVAVTTAGAQTATKFSAIEIVKSAHRVSHNKFVTRGVLVVPGDRDEVLGTDRVTFSRRGHGTIHAVAFFPDGKIKAQGRADHNRIQIVGGTRRWNGAAGKIRFQPLSHRATFLTFTVVQ
jgi:hypothetical protein